MRKGISTACVCACSGLAVGAPIATSDFDDGPQGWTLTASTVWQPTGGNPGGRIYGVVQEPMNVGSAASAPAPFLGDWSSYDGVGSLSFDFILISVGSNPVEFGPVSVSIQGPGGRAVWRGPMLTSPGPWQTFTAPIIEAGWDVESGSWDAILADVETMTIPIERINNNGPIDEEAAIDNVVLDSGAAPCVGDIDGDGSVGFGDLNVVLSAFNSGVGDPNYNADADLDGDEFVGFGDLNIVLSVFNSEC